MPSTEHDKLPPPTTGSKLEQYYRQPELWDMSRFEGSADQRLRARMIAAMIDPETKSVLDVGCGNGFVTQHIMAKLVVGLDPSPEALALFDGKKVSGLADALPFEDRSFETIVCAEVLEHLPDPVYDKVVKELARVARQQIIIGIPFDQDLREGMTRCADCGHTYHIDLHCRSYSCPEVFERDFRGWKTSAVVHLGQSKQIRSLLFRTLRYALSGPRARSEYARCPICSSGKILSLPIWWTRRLADVFFSGIAWRMPKKETYNWFVVSLKRTVI